MALSPRGNPDPLTLALIRTLTPHPDLNPYPSPLTLTPHPDLNPYPSPLTLTPHPDLNPYPSPLTLTSNPDLKPSQVALELPVRRDPRWARLRARLLRGRHRLPGQLPHLVAQRREECTERK